MTVHAPLRSGFLTTDPDRAHELIETAYVDNQLKVSGRLDDFRFEQARVDMGDVRLDAYHTTLTTEYHLEPFGSILVARVVEGVIENTTAGVSRRMGPGDVYLAARPHDPQWTRLQGARVELTAVELPLLAETDPEGYVRRLPQLGLAPLRPEVARRWQRNLEFVAALAAGRSLDTGPLVLGAAARLLAASVLDAFAPDGEVEGASDRRDASPEAVRRAVDFIEASADLDISPADIARAAYVGVRALQVAFRRHLDTTPMAYLRTVRLGRAHGELLAADPLAGTTVTDVALRWGFSNVTRFAALYRSVHGVTPGVTLRS